MKVILLEEVKQLGHEGEVVEVSEGYARNFLFPQHLAVEASEKMLKERRDKEKAASRKEKKQAKEDREQASAIDGLEVVIRAKADSGTLYGAVNEKDVAKAVKDIGYKIAAKHIAFPPQKETGEYEATVHYPSGLEAVLNVIIESK